LLRGFAKGLRKDWAAVTAGLTLPYSSGAVEGHVNRIKMIKRQMYGRAGFVLLPQARPARRLTRSRQLGQSHSDLAIHGDFLMATDKSATEPLRLQSRAIGRPCLGR
jgi:hypothetical protein